MGESQAAVRSGTQAEPNVTPFLDVLLVLLIIFMYLSLTQQHIQKRCDVRLGLHTTAHGGLRFAHRSRSR